MLADLSGVWLFTERAIGTRPLLTFGVLLEVVAVQMISVGVLSELILQRTAARPSRFELVAETVGVVD